MARLIPHTEDNASRLSWPFARVLLMIDEPEAGAHTRHLAALASLYRLTPAESKVLAQLAKGLTPTEIVEKGAMSIHTVRASSTPVRQDRRAAAKRTGASG